MGRLLDEVEDLVCELGVGEGEGLGVGCGGFGHRVWWVGVVVVVL